MVKEKRILSYFLGWLFVGFLVCFIGISDVFADEKLPLGYLSDKSNIQVVVPYNGAPLTLDQFGEYYLDDVDELLIFIDNYEFIGGKIYELELYLPNATLTNANIFTVSGVTPDNKTVSCDAMEILQENKKYVHYKWRCNKDVNSLTFNIKNSNDENIVSAGIFRWDYTYLLEVTSTNDNSEIIGGLNDIQQSIIDSNKETQDIINEQLGNKCNNLFENELQSSITHRGVTFTPIFKNGLLDYYNVSGSTTAQNSYAVIGYYDIPSGVTITVPKINGLYLQLYDPTSGLVIEQFNGSKTFNSSYSNIEFNIFADTNFNGSTSKFWVQVNEGNGTVYCPYGSYNSKLDNIEQSITDSNKETQEVIKDQFNNCRPSKNLFNINKNYSYGSETTSVVNKDSLTVTGKWFAYQIYNLKQNTDYNLSFDKEILQQAQNAGLVRIFNGTNTNNILTQTMSKNFTFNTGNNTSIGILFFSSSDGVNIGSVKFSNIMLNEGNHAESYEPYGEEICSNKIDETNDKLDNLQGALTDSSPTDMSGLGNSAGWLPAGPVDSILTLPLTMLNNLVNNLSSNNCQTAILQLPYVKKNINLPCIKTLYDKIGITGTLFQSAGLIASAFILFNYLLKLYQWVDNTLTMRENTMPGYFDDNWGGGA